MSALQKMIKIQADRHILECKEGLKRAKVVAKAMETAEELPDLILAVYISTNNVFTTANLLNQHGFRLKSKHKVNGKKLVATDVSRLITREWNAPVNKALLNQAQDVYKSNRRISDRFYT